MIAYYSSNASTPQNMNNRPPQDDDKPEPASDLVVGSVLFVIFIIFMTAWMYFRLPG